MQYFKYSGYMIAKLLVWMSKYLLILYSISLFLQRQLIEKTTIGKVKPEVAELYLD